MRILEKLKEKPNKNHLKLLSLIGFIIFLSLTIVFGLLTADRPEFVEYNVLEFEFAWTADQINIIFAAWGETGMYIQALAVYFDFLYIIGYTFFIFGVLLLISRNLNGKIQDITIVIALSAFLAGFFDVIENINLLFMLSDPLTFPTSSPFIASVSATIKFSLLFLQIIYFLIVVIVLLTQKNKNKKKR